MPEPGWSTGGDRTQGLSRSQHPCRSGNDSHAGDRALKGCQTADVLESSSSKEVLPSEQGLFELVARSTNLAPVDALTAFRDLLTADMHWVDSRKKRFRRRAAWVRVGILALTAASTVILGIPAIDQRAAIALPLVAGVTFLAGLDAFFNWRSRWFLMEETQYRLNRVRDEVDFSLVSEAPEALTQGDFARAFREQQDIWGDVSRRWVGFRRAAQAEDQASRQESRSPSRKPSD